MQTTEIRTKLVPPWATFVNEIQALFGDDPDIGITYDPDSYMVKMFVEDQNKAEALSYILPTNRTFGNIELTIVIIPANGEKIELTNLIDEHPANIFETAFKGNPTFSRTVVIHGLFNNDITYVVFKKEVVQFFNDNLNDVNGNVSTLYQEIAHDLFSNEAYILRGVCYCTEAVSDKLAKPLGEWP